MRQRELGIRERQRGGERVRWRVTERAGEIGREGMTGRETRSEKKRRDWEREIPEVQDRWWRRVGEAREEDELVGEARGERRRRFTSEGEPAKEERRTSLFWIVEITGSQ